MCWDWKGKGAEGSVSARVRPSLGWAQPHTLRARCQTSPFSQCLEVPWRRPVTHKMDTWKPHPQNAQRSPKGQNQSRGTQFTTRESQRVSRNTRLFSIQIKPRALQLAMASWKGHISCPPIQVPEIILPSAALAVRVEDRGFSWTSLMGDRKDKFCLTLKMKQIYQRHRGKLPCNDPMLWATFKFPYYFHWIIKRK